MTVLNSMYQCDLRLLKWCVKSREHQKFILFVRAVSRSGDGLLQVMIPLLIAWLINSWHFLIIATLAFSIERTLYFLLKHTLKRKRPSDIVPDFNCIVIPSDKFSFPSGHTMAAFLLAGLCSIELGGAAYPLYLWASAVGASRVILGVHFPSDILAGAIVGTSLLWLVY